MKSSWNTALVRQGKSLFVNTGVVAGRFGRAITNISSRSVRRFASKSIASVASFSVAFIPIATSFIPHHAYAQQIIIDPSAPSTSLFSSDNGTPQVNIATPNSGVSQNKFSNFNVGSDGLILNNSQSGGTSVTGGSVGANSNLSTSGPATVILNEVTGTNSSTLTGTTEVFGGKAAVIIANPNGIGCNGCNFINTSRTTLATGKTTVTGSDIGIRVTQGTLNIGRGGFTSEGSADLVGRHVVIDGQVQADDDLIVSGGSQQFNYNNSSLQSAPIVNAKKSPFAVDATEFGALTAGNIRVHGNESGLGVNTYGDINASGNVRLSSKGDLFYGNVKSFGTGLNSINAGREVRQYGNAEFKGDVEIKSRSFTLNKDRALETTGNVEIDTSKYVVIVGEIAAQDITIDTATSITNNGFLLADGELTIVAGDDIVNAREVAKEYDVYYDPAIQQYLEAYQAQLLSGNADEQAVASEFIARASAHDIIQEYVQKGATILGENVTLEANLDIDLAALASDTSYIESGDIRNVGGAIIGTRNVVLRAGEHILNQSITLRDKLNTTDGCDNNNCGYRSNFHHGEILSGGDITLEAGLNIENQASHIAAAGNIAAYAGQDIINTLLTSNYTLRGTDRTIFISGSRLTYGYGCEGSGKDQSCGQQYNVTPYSESTDVFYNDVNTVLAPGQIVTLSGDINLTAGRDYVSEGSEVSSGGNLSIDAGSKVVLSSFRAVEESFEYYNKNVTNCGGKDGTCSTSNTTVNIDGTELISSASILQGQNVSVVASNDITLIGARIFASEDLDIQSSNGSVLIDSTDLPDEVVGAEFAEVEFRELDENALTRLFQEKEFAQDFEDFIEENPLLAAVDALRRVENPNQIREVVRSVGLQSGRSIFQQAIDESVYDLRKELEDRIADLYAETEALDAEINAYHIQFDEDVAALQAVLGLSSSEVQQIVNDQVASLQVKRDTKVTSLKNTYDAKLVANQAQYGSRTTYQVRERYQVYQGGKDGGYVTRYRTVTKTNQTVVNQLNAANSNAKAIYDDGVRLANSQFTLDKAEAIAEGSQLDDASVRARIASLQASLDEQTAEFSTQRTVLFDRQSDEYFEAVQIARDIQDFESQVEDLGGDYIARDTAVEGEKSAAVALTNFGFGNRNTIHRNKSVDLAREFNINHNNIDAGLSSFSQGADNDIGLISALYTDDKISRAPVNTVSAAGYDVETIYYGDEGRTTTYTDNDNTSPFTSYIVYLNADGQNIAIKYVYDDGTTRDHFYGAGNGGNYDRHNIWYDASGKKTSEYTQFASGERENISFTYNADNKLTSKTTTLVDGQTENTNYVYADNGNLHYEDNYYADGTRNLIYQDHASTASWKTLAYQYNKDGERQRIHYTFDNDNVTVIDYDYESDQKWSRIDKRYNAEGAVTSVVKYNDDNSYELTGYDHGDAAYDHYTHIYNKDRKRTNIVYTYDDGRFFDYQYDYDETASWQRKINYYSAEGVHERTHWSYDDATKTLRYYDRENVAAWNTRTIRYDENNSIISDNYAADVESTIAEANFGQFFKDTKYRFENADGIKQLSRTPRAILYADNDLNLTAGRFVTTRVEDKTIAGRTYNRPNDLANVYNINTGIVGNQNGTPAAASFSIFDDVVSSIVTSDTPVNETRSVNSAGTDIHRKDFQNGSYSIEYATDTISFTDYYDNSGSKVAQKYFYEDGRVRDQVYATTSTNSETEEATTRNRIVAYYDTEGRIYVLDEYLADGSRERSGYDVASNTGWSNYKSTYNPNGDRTTIDYLYDAGHRYVYEYDTDSSETWERKITRYNSNKQLDSTTEELDDGAKVVAFNDYADANDWVSRIVTTAANGTVTTSFVDDLDRSNTRLENQLRGAGDIYIVGSSTVAAGNDININASRRLGLLGAVNTNFQLASNSHTAFDQIGENLQLGTLSRDVDAREVGVKLDANGNPILDTNGNTIRVDAQDATEGNLVLADQTRNYRLTNTVINAGGDLSLNASTTWNVESDIVNYGGSIVSGGNAYITSDGDIRNEVLRRNFTLTRDHGCVGGACGREGHDYKPAEILSGSGLIIASGGSVKNYGGNIGAAGAILISAEEDIVNEAITSQYLYHYINSSSFFGLKRRKEILNRAIIQEANISSTYGSITLDAGNDIRNHASLISAGSDITLEAGNDIELYAKSEEVHNYVKHRSIGFLSISQEETRFNEFGTAFSILEGNNIYATAGNNLIGTGTIANAASDLVLYAGNDLTFDAHQNVRYRETEGWSFGISFPGSNILAALADGDLSAALDEYIGSNPLLAAVHQLATAENGDQTRSAILGIGITGLQTSAAVGRGVRNGQYATYSDALAAQFNPFAGGPLDFANVGASPSVDGAPNTTGGDGSSERSFLDGITFRFSAYESREEWTESHITKLTSGRDLDLSSGNDLRLLGGTIATAGRDGYLYAEQDILLAALADTRTSESSSWGASVGFSADGVTIGGHAQSASSDAQLFTNAGLTAAENLDIYAGRDNTFAGANVAARDISIYSGRDLVVQSRQNVSNSESSGWNASVTINPAGIPVGGSFGFNDANSNREYTDTPTTIIGENSLDIYTEERTWLVGAVLDVTNSVGEDEVISSFDFDGRYTGEEARGLSLNTGSFVFDNLNDVDQSESISGGVSIGLSTNQAGTAVTGVSSFGTTPFAYSYHDRQGITFATVGEGLIQVRDVADGEAFDFRDLNRDTDDVQRLIKDESFEINLPAIQLSSLTQNLKDARAAFTGLSEEGALVREAANNERAILEAALGLRGEALRRFVQTPGFRNRLKFQRFFGDLVDQFGSIAGIPFDALSGRIDSLDISEKQREGYQAVLGGIQSFSSDLSINDFSGSEGRDYNNDGSIDQDEIRRFNNDRKITRILVLFGEIVNEIGAIEINDGTGGSISIDELSGELSGLFFRGILDFERARNGEESARELEQDLRELGRELSDFVTSTAERHAHDFGLSSEEQANLQTGILSAPSLIAGGAAGIGLRNGTGGISTPNRMSARDELIAELPNGTNITPDEVVTILRTSDGQVVWLETGNSRAGLQHINERHTDEFAEFGVQEADIPDFIEQALSDGNRIGTYNGAPVYLVGDTPVTVVVGDNGYIVTAYPTTTFDRF